MSVIAINSISDYKATCSVKHESSNKTLL